MSRVKAFATNAPLAKAPTTTTVANVGTGPFGTYMGNDFRAAYAPAAPQTGAGQNVALVQFDGYFASDIAAYETLAGLPSVTLTNILLNGFAGFPVTFNGNFEVSLDIEMVISMAPGVNSVMVYEGDPFNFLPNVVINQIAVDNAAKQVSSSWSWTGGPSATSDQIFKEMILQGQSYFNASGDFDAAVPGEYDNPGLSVFPLDDPYITIVGGTELTTATPGGSYTSESVWNDRTPNSYLGYWGSTGGSSGYYGIPWWQTNANTVANGRSLTFRNTPDVAMTAFNVLVIAAGGSVAGGEGTSAASPLWAGFTALVNQQAASNGRTSVGFLNPTLYALAAGPYYNSVFNDVTVGDNTWPSSGTNYFAVTNYDLCTGLGSPRGTNLINALVSSTNLTTSFAGTIPAPLPPWGNTLSLNNGANPNGPWLLYIQDDHPLFNGTNYNGWYVTLTTANPVGFFADNQLYASTAINSQPYGNATNVVATPGSFWQTTLAVTNYGPSFSTNVYVTDNLPLGLGVSLISSNVTVGSVSNIAGTLVWSVANSLPPGAGATLTLNFLISNTGIYTNSATVSAFTTDPNPDDDSVTQIVAVSVSTPPLITPGMALGGFQLSIANDAGATVVIQASTNLVNWAPVYTNVAPFTFTNFDNTNFQKRFYRAVVGP